MNGMSAGQRIADLRVHSNMTQEELAEKLYVSRQLVSLWENGLRRPDRQTVAKLSEIFSVPPDEICIVEPFVLSELKDCFPADCAVPYGDGLSGLLNGFITDLGDRERKIFIRRYYFEEDYSDIARKYGIKENVVRAVTARTRKKLKKYIRERII